LVHSTLHLFSFYAYSDLRDLHSFPTRRSSDLVVRRVGSETTDAVVNVRFIAATNTNPEQAVQSALLREDLYYRLREVPIHVPSLDRKSTRLNSSHVSISYAVFCLKKKKDKNKY